MTTTKKEQRRERPILMSGPMVRAILEGRKFQTRRVVKPQPRFASHSYQQPQELWWTFGDNAGRIFECPYGQSGDHLWVKETWALEGRPEASNQRLWLRADQFMGDPPTIKWRPSIHMPRWASRITLPISSVRVDRLQDISEEDAKAEGVAPLPLQTEECNGCCWTGDVLAGAKFHGRTAVRAFAKLWDSVDSNGPWDANPWVWVLTWEKAEIR